METLDALPLNHSGYIAYIDKSHPLRQRLSDLGITPGTKVTMLHQSIAKNPTAYEVRGAVLALRNEDARQIFIDPLKEGR